MREELLFCSLLGLFLYVSVPSVSGGSDTLWPLPVIMTSSGPSLPVSPAFAIQTISSSGVLKRGITRYLEIILKSIANQRVERRNTNETLNEIVVKVRSDNETLQVDTSYWYILQVTDGYAQIEAKTPFGALYGLETFSQLIEGGSIINSEIYIVDQPRYVHRGLMLDTGRRIFPIELLNNILDGMSYLKLNVLHFHLSDYCRFSVESKLYPDLQKGQSEFYTQEQVKSLVSYAADRGIRVIPEVEALGHANAMKGLANKTNGLKFCELKYGSLELYNDPEGTTVATMKGILEEMMSLFPDKFFHLGLDEVNPTPNCTLENMKSLEQELMEFLVQKGKIPYAWQEAHTATDAAIPGTLLQAWKNLEIKELIDVGFQIVDSLNTHFYLNKGLNSSAMWTDMGEGLNPDEMTLVLGGEMAMWTDTYCYILECFYVNRTKPVGWWMYGPDADTQFTESVTGIIWPQALIGAGSFWNYQSSLKPDSEEFQIRLTSQHKRMVERGVLTCPPGCTCDYLTRCGQPYPHPHPQ